MSSHVSLIRLLLIGDTSVGKTSLLLRFNEGSFILNQKTTIGVDYKAKEIDIDGELSKVQVWDTAGQERFRSMVCYALVARVKSFCLFFIIQH